MHTNKPINEMTPEEFDVYADTSHREKLIMESLRKIDHERNNIWDIITEGRGENR